MTLCVLRDDSFSLNFGLTHVPSRLLCVWFSSLLFNSFTVVHYTGPHKPWVANTTVSAKSLQPWLDYMKQEDMPIPDQLSTQPTQNLFLLFD